VKVKRGWAFVDDVAGVPSAFLKDVPKDIPVFDGDKQPLPDLTKDIPVFDGDKQPLPDLTKDIPVFDGDKQPLPDLTKDIPTFETDSVSEYDSKGNFIGGKKCQRYLRIFPS